MPEEVDRLNDKTPNIMLLPIVLLYSLLAAGDMGLLIRHVNQLYLVIKNLWIVELFNNSQKTAIYGYHI
jgi:hypothetical protein